MRWGFHAVALISSSAEEAVQAKQEVVNRVRLDGATTNWQRRCSYRVVSRAELDALKQREETALDRGAAAMAQVEDANKEAALVAVTPVLLAQAFQQLVSQDKRAFVSHQQEMDAINDDEERHLDNKVADLEKSRERHAELEPTHARMYLLVDYPSSLQEIDALLRLGEAGYAMQVTDGPEMLPLLPLIDGLVLLTDLAKASVPSSISLNSTAIANDMKNSSEPSVFQSSNAIVKAFYEAAQVGGAEWSDFTFSNVSCRSEASVIKQPEELKQELENAIEAIATAKFVFKNWVKEMKFSPVPCIVDDDGAMYNRYESILSGVFPASVGVSTVLFAVTEAVVAASLPRMAQSSLCNASHNSPTGPLELEEFIEHGDLVACRFAAAQLCHKALQADGNPWLLPQGSQRLDDVERYMWKHNDLPGISNGGRKTMPLVAELSKPERSIRDTELATFYKSPRLSCSMVHLTRQLVQVEEMLGSAWRGKLQSRAFLEKLARAILPQRIASVLEQNSPNVLSAYYAPTDSLLLVCLLNTAPGRMQSSSWVARDHVCHRPAFKDWKRDQPIPQQYLTSHTEAAACACVPLSAEQLALVATKTWSMYPADHSLVRLNQTPHGLVWLTVYHHGETFGLRSRNFTNGHKRENRTSMPHTALFVASFHDESTLCISEGTRKLPRKPDRFSTIMVTNSFPTGLIVSACSDGSIVQRYIRTAMDEHNSVASSNSNHEAPHESSNGMTAKECDAKEKYRVIYGKGSVLRVLECGLKEVMLASGLVQVICACKMRQHSLKKPKHHVDGLETTLIVDPETDALVERRPNGVIIVTYTSGARVTYHADGTRMYMNHDSTHVLVKKRSFADVCIDLKVNMTAQQHAAGDRVAVTKGGLRVRSVANIYDGTSVEISYNTKVTAQVNGRVTTRKPSGTIVVAKDSGRIEYTSHASKSAPTSSLVSNKDDDDRDVTTHNGVYYFNCRHGQFQLCDSEQNRFHVELDDEAGPNVVVDLAGVVSDVEAARYDVDSIPAKAVINEPIEPHIFVLNGDGTGTEILRPRDVAELFEGAAPETSEAADIGPSTSRHHVFLRQLHAPGERSQPLFNDPKLHEEMLKLQRPVATAGKHLQAYFTEENETYAKQQFTTVRRIQQIQPLSADELNEMHAGWSKWEQ